jgi:hypothetical protein
MSIGKYNGACKIGGGKMEKNNNYEDMIGAIRCKIFITLLLDKILLKKLKNLSIED